MVILYDFTCPCLLKVARLAAMEPLMISPMAPVKTGQGKSTTKIKRKKKSYSYCT